MTVSYEMYVAAGYNLVPQADFARCETRAENYLNARYKGVISRIDELSDAETGKIIRAVCETVDAFHVYNAAIFAQARSAGLASEKIGDYSYTAAAPQGAAVFEKSVRERVKDLIPLKFAYRGTVGVW